MDGVLPLSSVQDITLFLRLESASSNFFPFILFNAPCNYFTLACCHFRLDLRVITIRASNGSGKKWHSLDSNPVLLFSEMMCALMSMEYGGLYLVIREL